jgi:hypothetical protein
MLSPHTQPSCVAPCTAVPVLIQPGSEGTPGVEEETSYGIEAERPVSSGLQERAREPDGHIAMRQGAH